MKSCSTGKRSYSSFELAEEALIGAWIAYEYGQGKVPVNVYQCEDCGEFHLTSQGEMNLRLAQALKRGEIDKDREAKGWEDKFKRR